MGMMGKVKELQARVAEAQENLVRVQATGEAGAGLVRATVNGKKQVISLAIDASLLQPKDQSIVQDLVVAAINKANEEAETLARESMRKSTEGLLPNIPGLDLSNLMR